MYSRIAPILGCFAVVAALSASAQAAPSRSSVSLVVVSSSSTTVAGATVMPSFGSQVTYVVSTSASQPWVETDCYRNGALVYNDTRGFFSGYYTDPVFTLGPTLTWTGGAANCTANLFSVDQNGKRRALASTSFSVSA